MKITKFIHGMILKLVTRTSSSSKLFLKTFNTSSKWHEAYQPATSQPETKMFLIYVKKLFLFDFTYQYFLSAQIIEEINIAFMYTLNWTSDSCFQTKSREKQLKVLVIASKCVTKIYANIYAIDQVTRMTLNCAIFYLFFVLLNNRASFFCHRFTSSTLRIILCMFTKMRKNKKFRSLSRYWKVLLCVLWEREK